LRHSRCCIRTLLGWRCFKMKNGAYGAKPDEEHFIVLVGDVLER
jgi:hypothetical protein